LLAIQVLKLLHNHPLLELQLVTHPFLKNKKMAPQKYADLGKEARDLESKNFHFGVVKVEAKTKAKNGTDLTVDGTHNTDTGDVVAALETKFKYAPYGISFTEKWNTNNVITSTIGVEKEVAEGLVSKVDLDTTYAPDTGKKSVKVKTAHQYGDLLHATVDIDFANFALHTSGVLAYNGIHAGYQASIDTANKNLLGHNVGLLYKNNDIVFQGGIINGSKYVGSVHHQVSKNLCAAALVHWSSGSSTSLTACGKYALDDDTHVKAKLDNQLNVGLAYVQNVKPGLQLTLSSLINAKSFEQGGHKLGLSLNFDA